MPTAAGWTTLEALRSWLRFDTANPTTTDDSLLVALAAQTVQDFIAYLGRDIASTPYAEKYDGRGRDCISLDQWPVISITSVVIDNQTISASSNGSYGYEFHDQQLWIIGGVFPQGRRNVSVSYTAGYATIPADLVLACIRQAAYVYREREHIGMKSVAVQGQTISYEGDLLPGVKSCLDKHMRLVVGV